MNFCIIADTDLDEFFTLTHDMLVAMGHSVFLAFPNGIPAFEEHEDYLVELCDQEFDGLMNAEAVISLLPGDEYTLIKTNTALGWGKPVLVEQGIYPSSTMAEDLAKVHKHPGATCVDVIYSALIDDWLAKVLPVPPSTEAT